MARSPTFFTIRSYVGEQVTKLKRILPNFVGVKLINHFLESYEFLSRVNEFQVVYLNSLYHDLADFNGLLRLVGPETLNETLSKYGEASVRFDQRLDRYIKVHPFIDYQRDTLKLRKILMELKVRFQHLHFMWGFESPRFDSLESPVDCKLFPQNWRTVVCAQGIAKSSLQGVVQFIDFTHHTSAAPVTWFDDHLHYGRNMSTFKLMSAQILIHLLCLNRTYVGQ